MYVYRNQFCLEFFTFVADLLVISPIRGVCWDCTESWVRFVYILVFCAHMVSWQCALFSALLFVHVCIRYLNGNLRKPRKLQSRLTKGVMYTLMSQKYLIKKCYLNENRSLGCDFFQVIHHGNTEFCMLSLLTGSTSLS